MKIENVYVCDRCGKENDRDNKWSLSTSYQCGRYGLHEYGKCNYGVRHLCNECKKEFDVYFKKFFSFYNQCIINSNLNQIK